LLSLSTSTQTGVTCGDLSFFISIAGYAKFLSLKSFGYLL
jgi:hypothetical protein